MGPSRKLLQELRSILRIIALSSGQYLHNHAKLELVLLNDLIRLSFQLINIPLRIDEAARSPRTRFLREPHAYCTAESDIISQHWEVVSISVRSPRTQNATY